MEAVLIELKKMIWDIERLVFNKLGRAFRWIKTVEIPVYLVTTVVSLLVVVVVFWIKKHNSETFLHSIEKPVEIFSSFINFVGVMLIAQGVMLSKRQKDTLYNATFFVNLFPKLTKRLLVEASNCCEKGMLLVIFAYILDMVSKFAL